MIFWHSMVAVDEKSKKNIKKKKIQKVEIN